MKKNLLFTMCMLAGISAFAQFTPGNLAVYRYGDGVAPMVNGNRVPVFIDEYNPATGNVVNTIAIPHTVNGGNYGFEGLGLTTTGTFNAEGYPVLSRDGSTLSIMGYNPANVNQFVIGTVNASGNVSTNTLVVDTDLGDVNSPGSPRSAAVEGTAVYFSSFSGGVRYKQLGTATASTRISVGQNATRVVSIADLMQNNVASARIFAPENANNIPMASLVTTSTNFTTNSYDGVQPSNAHQIAAVKSSTRTLLYVIDDNGPVIRKYRSNAGGTTWFAKGQVSVAAGTKSIAVVKTATGARLYFTTIGTPGGNDSRIFTIEDLFTVANDGDVNLTGTPTLVATAPANTTFRGVTMAPGTTVLPVSLTNFEAKEVDKTIRLKWSTSSEKNSLNFEILKSFNGKDFQKIGEVKAVGNSDANIDYSFVDENPFPGVNYYKLQQFDNNGESSLYGPVQVTSKVEKTDFNIHASASKGNADLFLFSTIQQKGTIRILSLGGQILHEEAINLDKGYTQITLPVSGVKSGLQIAILNAQSETIAKKFVWQ